MYIEKKTSQVRVGRVLKKKGLDRQRGQQSDDDPKKVPLKKHLFNSDKA